MTRAFYIINLFSAAAIPSSCYNRQTDELDRGLEALYKTGDYDKAIASFTELIRKDPFNKSQNYCGRGIAYSRKGEYDKAIADLSEAIRIRPDLYLAYVARGDVFYLHHDFRKALSDYNVGIRLKPNRSTTYFNRGLVKYQLSQYDGAIEDCSAAIRLQPSYVDAYIERGNNLQALGSNREAIENYSNALKYAPNNFRALYNRGLVYRKLKSYKLAIDDFTHAIKVEPNNYLGYCELAWELSTCPQNCLRNGTRAIECAKQGCEFSKWKKPVCLDTLAAAYAESGNFDLALKWENEALADPEFDKSFGDSARTRLALYKNHRPYRRKP